MENEKRKLEWLEFDQLESYPHVVHGVFLRHGGVSVGPYTSLNVSTEVGDHPDSVKFNRLEICKALDVKQIVFPHQQHGVTVVRITGANCSKAHQADALFTTEKNIALAVTHGDCQAAIFYDPVHEAIGAAHAGWRGSAQNIYAKLIEEMKKNVEQTQKISSSVFHRPWDLAMPNLKITSRSFPKNFGLSKPSRIILIFGKSARCN